MRGWPPAANHTASPPASWPAKNPRTMRRSGTRSSRGRAPRSQHLAPRIEMRKNAGLLEDPVPARVREERRHGPLARLAGRAVKVARERLVPEAIRPRRVAPSAVSAGIIEPAARRFQLERGPWAWAYTGGKHYIGMSGRYMGLAGEPVLDGQPDPRGRFGEDPLELLLRLQSVTGARYAGEETIRETQCRKGNRQRWHGPVHGLGGRRTRPPSSGSGSEDKDHADQGGRNGHGDYRGHGDGGAVPR